VALSYTAPTTSTGPAPPTITTLTQSTINFLRTVKLTWTDNAVNEARFEVFRCTLRVLSLNNVVCLYESIGNVTSTSTAGTGNSYSFSRLSSPETYRQAARHVLAAGPGSPPVAGPLLAAAFCAASRGTCSCLLPLAGASQRPAATR
jgi:hypothetical protein